MTWRGMTRGGHPTWRFVGVRRSRLPPGYQPWDQCWPRPRGRAQLSSSSASSSSDPRGAMAGGLRGHRGPCPTGIRSGDTPGGLREG